MVVRTIAIDLDADAYEALRRRKRSGQSFSQAIREHFAAPKTGCDPPAALDRFASSPDTVDALARVLKGMCDKDTRATTAGKAQKKTMVHLFGILFANEIEECDGAPTRIAQEVALKAGLPAAYATEINNGRLLAEYVVVHERSILEWRA